MDRIRNLGVIMQFFAIDRTCYLVLSQNGVIKDINKTGSMLLNSKQSSLLNRNFIDFVKLESRPIFIAFLKELFEKEIMIDCEIKLQLKNLSEIYVHIEAIINNNNESKMKECYAVMVNITEQKLLEEALRESEQRLKFHFENSPLAVVEWNNNFVVTQWSLEAEHIFGWKKEEVLGKRIDTLNMIYTDDIPIVNQTMERLSGGSERKVVSSNRNITKSGNIIECTWYNSVLFDKNGHMSSVMSLVEDITESKRAEEALRESEERFRSVLDNSRDIVYRLNLRTGKFEYMSPSTAETTGFSSDELSRIDKEAVEKLVHPDDFEMVISEFKRIDEEGRGEVTYRQRKKNGEYSWISDSVQSVKDETGKPLYRYGVARDITEQRRIEEALLESERREHERAEELAVLLDAVPTPVIIAQEPECNHLIGNRAAKELFKLSSDGEISLTASPERRPHHYKAVKENRELRLEELPIRRAAKGENVQDFEYTLVFEDGTSRELVAYATPLNDGQGNPRGAVHTLVDITERKKAEEKLQTILQRFYLILSSMQLGILLVNNDDRIEFANQTFCDIFNFKEPPSDLTDMSAEEMIEKIRPCYMGPDVATARIAEIVRLGQPVHSEDVDMCSEKAYLRDFIPIRLGEKLYGRLWIHRDITERKRAEEILAFQARLLSEVHDAVFSSDSNFTITYWNQAAEKMFGWTKKEVLGKNSGELLKPKVENSSRDQERS